MDTTIYAISSAVKVIFGVVFILQVLPLLIWMERKGSAMIQDRLGPNRANVLGIRAAGHLHAIADLVKAVTKEDVVPNHVNKPFWTAAPMISVGVAAMTFAVVPWGDTLTIPGEWLGAAENVSIPLQIADINGGVLYVLALTSVGVYGIMLAGWASNNKFALLGGLRSSAQMVSYELSMGLALVAMFMLYGTVQLDDIARIQSQHIWYWGILMAPPVGIISFILFWTAVFAETNRTPFDLPEAEAELVAGYHTEYSSVRFLTFVTAEYMGMIVASGVTATMFFGGYNLPFISGADLRAHISTVLMVIGAGGAVTFAVASALAFRRRNHRLYKAIPADDPRHREWKLFTALWALASVAHVGVLGLGAADVVGHLDGPLKLFVTELLVVGTQLNVFAAKILVGGWIFVWVRWTLPRFRYDQLMDLGWKRMLPLALANVALAGIWLLLDASVFGLYSDFNH